MTVRILSFLLVIKFLNFTTYCCAQNVLPEGFKQETVKINANADDWTSSGIMVNKQDFVIFEVSGEIILGPWAGSSTGEGLIYPRMIEYNRYPSFWHGSLICNNSKELISAQSILQHPSWKLGFSEEDFVGNCFVSNSQQELKFIINDNDYDNNEGSYQVKVTIIPFYLHQARNKFNKCPLSPPKKSITGNNNSESNETDEKNFCVDDKGLKWTNGSDWSVGALKEKYFHGGGMENLYSNNTFRGISNDIKGSQCTYNSSGKLVNDNIYMGTYDYAFGLPDLENRLKYHTLWDVFPHDAYLEYFEKQNKTFEYESTKIIY